MHGEDLPIKSLALDYRRFHWQRGYGAFSVSSTSSSDTWRPRRNTIAAAPFRKKYRQFLRKYGVEYNDRDVWD